MSTGNEDMTSVISALVAEIPIIHKWMFAAKVVKKQRLVLRNNLRIGTHTTRMTEGKPVNKNI